MFCTRIYRLAWFIAAEQFPFSKFTAWCTFGSAILQVATISAVHFQSPIPI